MPTQTFDTVGSHTYDVPSAAEALIIECWGAEGGNGDGDRSSPGDEGGYIRDQIPVDELSQSDLDVEVGGAGGSPSGGYNGGGNGGNLGSADGGGGGGASDVRDGSDLDDRIVVGAGGGGGSASEVISGEDAWNGGPGGQGGADQGQDGGTSQGGTGGTQSSGGSIGGSLGTGGNGESSNRADDTDPAGGGGGGGYYGGGGGSENTTLDGGTVGGGGGGSNFADSAATVETNDRGGNTGDGEVVITSVETLPTVQNVAIEDEWETELEVSWDGVDEAEEYDVHRHDESDPYDDGTEVTTIDDDGSSSYSFTDTGLTNGRQYHYQVVGDNTTDEEWLESDPSPETTGTTELPTTPIDSITADSGRELDLAWTKQDDNPDGDWEILRDGSSVATVAVEETSYTDTGLDHGTEYSYLLRRSTPDTSADGPSSSATTLLPAPSDVTAVTDTYDTRLDVSWTDEADGEASFDVEISTDGRTVDEGSVGMGATEHTTGDVVPNRENADAVDVTVYATTADTASSGTSISASVPSIDTTEGGWVAALRLDGQLRQIGADAWIATPSWRSEPSAITTWQASIPWDTSLEDWMRAEAFVYFDDRLLLRGELHNPTSTDGDGTTQLSGEDVIAQLDRGGAAETYESIEAWRAVADYEDQYLDEWDVTVHEPDADIVDDGLVVQDDLTESFTDLDTYPVDFADGEIPLLQSNWVWEAENPDRVVDDGFSTAGSGDYSGTSGNAGNGAHQVLDTEGQVLEYDFGNEYTIPGDALDFRMRTRNGTDVELTVSIDESTVVTIGAPYSSGLLWFDARGSDGSGGTDFAWSQDLEPGEHTLRIEVTSVGSDPEPFEVDVVSLPDTRYDYNFDSSVTANDGGNYLDGPEKFPIYDLAAEQFDQPWNVVEASIVASLNDTSGEQRLQVSNDGGDSYHPQDGTESNTESVTHEFDDPGTVVRSRVTLSRHSPDGNQEQTPAFGYAGQTLQSWELSTTTNDIGVIDEEEFVGSHWENWQLLHERAGMVFVPEYDEEQFFVDSFTPGEVAREADWRTLDHTRDPDTTDYANQLTAYGAVDEDTGERITATAEVADEVEAFGAVPGAPLFEDDVEDEERLRNVVRRELGSLVEEGSLKGSVEIVPKPLRPGFGHTVPELDDETLALWGVQFDDSGGSSGSLEFGEPEDLASVLTSIRVDVRETRL